MRNTQKRSVKWKSCWNKCRQRIIKSLFCWTYWNKNLALATLPLLRLQTLAPSFISRNKIHHNVNVYCLHIFFILGIRPFKTSFVFPTQNKNSIAETRISAASLFICNGRRSGCFNIRCIWCSNIHKSFTSVLIILSFSGFLFGLLCIVHHKFMKVGKLETSSDSVWNILKFY